MNLEIKLILSSYFILFECLYISKFYILESIMNFKRYIDLRLIGIIGSIFLILSQFLAWYSELNLMTIFIVTSSIAIEQSFLYLFPLISGIICFIGTFIILYKIDYKLNSVIINVIGLGFFLIFLVEIVIYDFPYISSIGIGFYFSIIGALLILLDILNILKLNNNLEDGREN